MVSPICDTITATDHSGRLRSCSIQSNTTIIKG